MALNSAIEHALPDLTLAAQREAMAMLVGIDDLAMNQSGVSSGIGTSAVSKYPDTTTCSTGRIRAIHGDKVGIGCNDIQVFKL